METYYCVLSEVRHRTLFWELFRDFSHKGKLLEVMLHSRERHIAEVMKYVVYVSL